MGGVNINGYTGTEEYYKNKVCKNTEAEILYHFFFRKWGIFVHYKRNVFKMKPQVKRKRSSLSIYLGIRDEWKFTKTCPRILINLRCVPIRRFENYYKFQHFLKHWRSGAKYPYLGLWPQKHENGHNSSLQIY